MSLPNQEQTHNIDEMITETKQIYHRILDKISDLNETIHQEAAKELQLEADLIMKAVNLLSAEIRKNSYQRIEIIKDTVLAQLDKISDLEMKIKNLYSREFNTRIIADDELVEVLSSPSPEAFRRNLALDFEEAVAENSQNLNPSKEKQTSENLGIRNLISPCNSSFSVQINYEEEDDIDANCNQDESLSFEEQQPGHYTVRSRSGGLTQRNREGIPEKKDNPFIKEIENYEVDSLPKTKKTQNTIESMCGALEDNNMEKKEHLSKSFGEEEYRERLLLLRDSSKLFEFLGEESGAAVTKEVLWKYIFYLQEHLSANKEIYERRISELEKEITLKDTLLYDFMKNQQKIDINAEAKYYENLQLAHNSKKLISKLRNMHSGQENKDLNSQKLLNTTYKLNTELSHIKCNKRYTLTSSYASLPKKSPTNTTLENFRRLNLPLLDISTNQSLESLDEQAELNFTGKYYGGEPERFFTTGESHSFVSVKHGEDEVVFSSQDNFKAYFNNLQETLEVMKENNSLIHEENCQLKEQIKSLQEEVTGLKKENERIRGHQRSAQKPKEVRTFQPVAGANLKWANAQKFHELEQQNKKTLERFKSFTLAARAVKV